MKMKEQNAWLSLAIFFQVVVAGCASAIVSEVLKDDKNFVLITLVSSLGVLVFGAMARLYHNVFSKIKRRKK